MGKLQVLPQNLANMIAAGEVVQRPASVVKELMENAVDAGATSVRVLVADAGRTLIQVIDDGSGMSAADAVLCFERHATSKISTPEDLEKILTFGFRGEALASIAAVAEITLKTRREKDELATQVVIGMDTKTSSVSAPVGSNFAVRNLFYNTPARRKFLKSDAVELKHIVDEFTRVAITRPDIAFTLTSNGKDMFVLRKASSAKFRILDLLGSNVVGDIVDVELDTALLNIRGFVGRPDSAKKTLGNQYFFVNGRFFKSPYLHKAVMNAYQDFIPDGVTPSYFLFIELDPQSVDVNIHPTKTEIKFEEDSLVFQTIYACVKETLGKNSFGASIDFDAGAGMELPQLGKSFDEYRGLSAQAPGPAVDGTYNPFEPDIPLEPNTEFYSRGDDAPGGASSSRYSDHIDRRENYGALFEGQQLSSSAKLLIVQGKYIVRESTSGIMIVNIRRARERILYERALEAMQKNEHVTQVSLFPVQLQVGAAQRLLFEEHTDLLTSLGFDISSFGSDTIVVNGVPEGFSCEPGKVQQMVADLLQMLSDEHSTLPELMRQGMAERFAVMGAMGGEPLTNPLQAQSLLDSLFSCSSSENTPSGRRIVSIMSVEEIDKKF